MSGTIGLEFERVMGQQFRVQIQELSSARGGCRMGISA
jgi:hypothetical protein